jgi:hypothetical protein
MIYERGDVAYGEPYSDVPIEGATVPEIHLDFLLWEELQVDRNFLREFAKAIGERDELDAWVEVQHSVTDLWGEADLIARYRTKSGLTVAILIEDKIGAAFQPDQAKRYKDRGDAGQSGARKRWDRYVTCLVAPSKYIEQGHGFQRAVSIEAIRGWLQASDPPRREFRDRILERALDQPVKRIDSKMSEFRRRYYKLLKEKAPKLSMNEPGLKSGAEPWFQLKYDGLPKGVYILHKAPLGVVDLTLPNTDAAVLHQVAPWLEYGMEIKQTGKSSSIRLSVPAIEKFDDFDSVREQALAAFNAAMRLAMFGGRERERLIRLRTDSQ